MQQTFYINSPISLLHGTKVVVKGKDESAILAKAEYLASKLLQNLDGKSLLQTYRPQ